MIDVRFRFPARWKIAYIICWTENSLVMGERYGQAVDQSGNLIGLPDHLGRKDQRLTLCRARIARAGKNAGLQNPGD